LKTGFATGERTLFSKSGPITNLWLTFTLTSISGLPVKTATRHLEAVNQLLQWLQTCSALNDFDDLIVMVQSLRSLNPLQMRRATRDYRYEVSEAKMSEECSQYLSQLQRDWDRRRLVSEKERLRQETYGHPTNPGYPGSSPPPHPGPDGSQKPSSLEPATDIDSLFDPNVALGEYTPPTAPECMGELLDSRFMLPFSLPSDVDLLVATPPPGAAFILLRANTMENEPPSLADSAAVGPLMSPSLVNEIPRPSSRSSFSSTRPLRYASRPRRSLRDLPEGFLPWLAEEELSRRPLGQRLVAALESSRPQQPSANSDSSLHPQQQASDKQFDSRHLSLVSQSWLHPSNLSSIAAAASVGPQAPPQLYERGPRYPSSLSHTRDDSERTVSSHGRDASSKTIRRPEPRRSSTIKAADGRSRTGGNDADEREVTSSPESERMWSPEEMEEQGTGRPSAEDRKEDGRQQEATESSGGTGNRGSWLQRLPLGRSGTLKREAAKE
jgi:hypothetical protein